MKKNESRAERQHQGIEEKIRFVIKCEQKVDKNESKKRDREPCKGKQKINTILTHINSLLPPHTIRPTKIGIWRDDLQRPLNRIEKFIVFPITFPGRCRRCRHNRARWWVRCRQRGWMTLERSPSRGRLAREPRDAPCTWRRAAAAPPDVRWRRGGSVAAMWTVTWANMPSSSVRMMRMHSMHALRRQHRLITT